MRLIVTISILCSLLSPSLLFASDQTAVSAASSTMDALLERAISRNLIAGGVVVVGNHDGIISTSARGTLNATGGAPALDEHTVFDVASLTKVVATTPAVMKLVDEGRVALSDPLSRWFPEFAGSQITILNLMTHTSGLNDVALNDGQPMQSAVRKAAAQLYRLGPESRFNYADINFILLGELISRVTGETLDEFCRQEVYGPLGTRETMFLPPRDLAGAIAPTSGTSGGIVQDLNARRLGGVAGHAGLFSSAHDLSRYARLMLGRGILDERRILSEQVVSQMTTPYLCNNGNVKRGLGWDIHSPFSAPKGIYFSESSFGHTGYSGSSIWIDPQQDLFVILLTRRLNYSDVRNFNQLRRDVSTVAVADFRAPGEDGNPAASLELIKVAASLELIKVAAPAHPVAEPPLKAATRTMKTAALSHRKGKHQLRADRRGGRGERMVVAKAGRGHRVNRISGVAKAETCKTTPGPRKKRALVKG